MKTNGHHIYQGECPDQLSPYSRDGNCPACRALMFYDSHSAPDNENIYKIKLRLFLQTLEVRDIDELMEKEPQYLMRVAFEIKNAIRKNAMESVIPVKRIQAIRALIDYNESNGDVIY